MSRAPALRKLLAIGGMYRDEIFTAMGGERADVVSALFELQKAGELRPIRHNYVRQVYRLTDGARAVAFA